MGLDGWSTMMGEGVSSCCVGGGTLTEEVSSGIFSSKLVSCSIDATCSCGVSVGAVSAEITGVSSFVTLLGAVGDNMGFGAGTFVCSCECEPRSLVGKGQQVKSTYKQHR